MDLDNIDISKLPAEVRKELLQIDVTLAEKHIKNKAKDDFMSFVKAVWPEFIEGAHHRIIAQKFNDLATGKITRLIVNHGTGEQSPLLQYTFNRGTTPNPNKLCNDISDTP